MRFNAVLGFHTVLSFSMWFDIRASGLCFLCPAKGFTGYALEVERCMVSGLGLGSLGF